MTKAVQDLMIEVERVCDAFHRAVWVDADPDAAVALADPDCSVVARPLGITLSGTEALRAHVRDEIAGQLPDDLAFGRISRTGDRWRVADELAVTFTHDREMPWLLPGTAPTGRATEMVLVRVIAVRRSRVTACRLLW